MKCLCATTRRAARAVSRVYEDKLRPVDLTPAQFELMQQIAAAPGRSQGALAKAMDVDQTTLSRNLQLLVGRGLVERECVAGDRRQTGYGLTGHGLTAQARAVPLWQEAQEQMKGWLGGDLQTVQALLERLGDEVDPERA